MSRPSMPRRSQHFNAGRFRRGRSRAANGPGGAPITDLSILASQIDELAPEDGAPALHLLATDLRANRNALIGMDLVTAFPPQLLLPDRDADRTRIVTGLELLRDLLVFVPVFVTWFQLRSALQAYQKSVQQATVHHQAPVSFLLGWQRGFPHVWPLSKAALVVAVIVGLIIVLTGTVHVVREIVERLHSRAGQREQLTSLLAQGTMLLTRIVPDGVGSFSRKDIAPLVKSFYENSDKLTVSLERVGNQIKDSLEISGPKLSTALKEWSNAARDLRELGRSLTGPAKTLEELAKLEKTIAADSQRLTTVMDDLIRQLGEHTQASGQESAAHRYMAGTVTEATQQVHSALDLFIERLETLGILVNEMRRAIERAQDNGYDRDSGHGWS